MFHGHDANMQRRCIAATHTRAASQDQDDDPEALKIQCISAARSCISAAEPVIDLVPPSHYLAFCVHYLTLSGVVL
jgi:hypothetical protein